MPRKQKDGAAVSEQDSLNKNLLQEKHRSKKSRKSDPEAHHRLRNVAFALIVVLLLLVMGFMIASRLLPEYSFLNIPRRAIAWVMQPVQSYFSSGTGWFVEYIQRLKLRSNIEYEYEQLYEKYDALLSQNMMVNELQTQLNEYSELMYEMQTHSQFDGVPAKVISTDSTNYFSTLQINIGSDQGIQDYMAVVKAGGLVGYTYDVTETTAKVQTIINSDTSIPALIESTRYQGTVKGTMGINGEPTCRMYYLSDNHLPRQGDTVVTSGVGVEFPKGIPIGVVRESTRGMEEGKAFVVIEPIVDFERVEYVIVYRYVPPYTEQAERRDETDLIYTGLPTARPVPTFFVSGESVFNPSAVETPLVVEAAQRPASENTPAPGSTMGIIVSAAETPIVENLSYDDIPGTPTPEPTPSPTPTPTPVPTFSLNSLTQDGED
ncbi:MAG: rod shape-determining protein MreC [Clostridia bacterium]|nr:rod shape-determining protein MreC [Clostridia bacterium]